MLFFNNFVESLHWLDDMSDVLQLLEDFEISVSDLRNRFNESEMSNRKLYTLLNIFEKDNEQLYEKLKLLDTVLAPGSSAANVKVEDIDDIRLRIGELIKEIDSCILQLSK